VTFVKPSDTAREQAAMVRLVFLLITVCGSTPYQRGFLLPPPDEPGDLEEEPPPEDDGGGLGAGGE